MPQYSNDPASSQSIDSMAQKTLTALHSLNKNGYALRHARPDCLIMLLVTHSNVTPTTTNSHEL